MSRRYNTPVQKPLKDSALASAVLYALRSGQFHLVTDARAQEQG